MDQPGQLWIVTEEIEPVAEVEGRRTSQDVGGQLSPTGRPGGMGVVTAPKQTGLATPRRTRTPLDAQALKTQMQGLLNVVEEVFDQASQQSGLNLDEVELTVEINAEGQVSLLGNGGKLGDKGGIKLKFKRVPPTVPPT